MASYSHPLGYASAMKLLFLLTIALPLTACGSSGPKPQPLDQFSLQDGLLSWDDSGASKKDAGRRLARLLRSASRSEEPQATWLRLSAAHLALDVGDLELAQHTAETTTEPYATQQITRDHIFLLARLALADRDPQAALDILARPSFKQLTLTQDLQFRAGQIRASAYQQGRNYLAAARQLVYLDDLLAETNRGRSNERIFANLMQLDQAVLQRHAETSATPTLRGWLALAFLAKRYEGSPRQQLDALTDWQAAWHEHPAAVQVPKALQLLPEVVRQQPSKVALMLPMSGNLRSIGEAIRDGFIAAHYRHSPEVEVALYDTSQGKIEALFNQAWQQGAELIIGPLDRDRVAQVARMTLSSPVVALNRARNGAKNPNLYQFGLAPEDEAMQVAEQLINEGLHKGLVIAPDSDWGDRSLAAFKRAFGNLGGEVVDSTNFEAQRDYSPLVRRLLKVDASEVRAQAVGEVVQQSLEFTPRRRKDINFIFLLSNPDQARGITPTLAFFYADDVPVYATSHVHELGESRINLIDMSGIQFCDLPYKLSGSNPTRDAVQNLWPEASGRLAPFYALGMDAHLLYPRLAQLSGDPSQRVFGATGILALTEANLVKRILQWARFTGDQVEKLPSLKLEG